jgi:hypothetical protein
MVFTRAQRLHLECTLNSKFSTTQDLGSQMPRWIWTGAYSGSFGCSSSPEQRWLARLFLVERLGSVDRAQ